MPNVPAKLRVLGVVKLLDAVSSIIIIIFNLSLCIRYHSGFIVCCVLLHIIGGNINITIIIVYLISKFNQLPRLVYMQYMYIYMSTNSEAAYKARVIIGLSLDNYSL